MQTFSSDGIEIAFIDEPQSGGRPTPVLLIHGFASNIAANWIGPGWVRHLSSDGYRVIALDNRGHGGSQKLYEPAAYHRAKMAEDARRLLDHLGIARAHVLGYSMGARIAATLALAHPDRLASAIFGGLGINMVHGLDGADAISAALEAPTLDGVTDAQARGFRVFADQTHSDRRALAACIRTTREPIAALDIARIRCPVLVAVGSTDEIAGSAADLAALIPGARVLDITGRDHMRAVGDRVFKDGVSAFLASLP